MMTNETPPSKRFSPILLILVFCATIVLVWMGIHHFGNPFREDRSRQARASLIPEDKTPRIEVVLDEGMVRKKDGTGNFFCELGTLDPTDHAEYRFRVINRGEAPLKLQRGKTTCQCTMSSIPETGIPPGMGAIIEISSKLRDEEKGEFTHGSEVYTNDPECPLLTFRIHGTIRTILDVDRKILSFQGYGELPPQEGKVTLYSEVWDDFDLLSVTSSNEAFQWRFEEAGPVKRKQLEATSAKDLFLDIPSHQEVGNRIERLLVEVAPRKKSGELDETEAREVTVLVDQTVHPPYEFIGKRLNSDDVLDMGKCLPGQKVQATIMLKIRDENPVLDIHDIRVKPDFVEAECQPAVEGKPEKGIYIVNISLTPGATPGVYSGENSQVRLLTRHDSIPEIVIPLHFIVLNP